MALLHWAVHDHNAVWSDLSQPPKSKFNAIAHFSPTFFPLSNMSPRPLIFFWSNLSKKWLAVSVLQIVPEFCYFFSDNAQHRCWAFQHQCQPLTTMSATFRRIVATLDETHRFCGTLIIIFFLGGIF